MTIKFGPAGLGGINEAISNLEEYHKLGLKACEIAFTYGIYIKEKDVNRIKKAAEKFDIELSIHAPYWINLNSAEKEKTEKSKERILNCCEIGEKLGAKKVVFHPGYYGKMDKGKAYENIRNAILELEEKLKERHYKIKLCPETSGKINVFGTVDEIARLVRDTKCSFCIDFAHVLARYKEYRFKEVLNEFKDSENLHIHFSGIEHNEKGERHHKLTPEKDIKKLLEALPKDKKIVIINESPSPIQDAFLSFRLYKG